MKKIACTLVHTGKFFQYKNQGQFYSTIIRGDSVQMEINAQTGDTTNWKIHWIDNCSY